jgi:hypothetical protein
MIVSKTAVSHGYGRDPYKWVSGLTNDERAAVRNGETVVYLDTRLSGGNNGHYLRVVKKLNFRWTRRVADVDTVREFEKATGINTRRGE